MNEPLSDEALLVRVFKALGDPTRLRIFQVLRCCDGEVMIDDGGGCHPSNTMSVGEVCCRLGQNPSTVSHHLKELRIAGLIHVEKRGRCIYCSINPAALELVAEWARPSLVAETGDSGSSGANLTPTMGAARSAASPVAR